MRRLLAISVSFLFAAAITACDERPVQPDSQTAVEQVAANASSQNASSGAPHPIATVRTWANTSDMWEFLVPQPLAPANQNSTAPLWVIEPVDDPDSPHATAFFGPHDHVVPAPKQNRGEFSAMWHVHLVTDGPPQFDADGKPTNLTNTANIDATSPGEELLTSHARVQKAVDMGLVTSTPLPGVFFPCPVRSL